MRGRISGRSGGWKGDRPIICWLMICLVESNARIAIEQMQFVERDGEP
jgi:hypothetical protein